jgi:hypothetical protein
MEIHIHLFGFVNGIVEVKASYETKGEFGVFLNIFHLHEFLLVFVLLIISLLLVL